jgi:hypothetical protein
VPRTPEYAAALANRAGDLGTTGHPAQALSHAEQAVAIYREAARPNPGRFNFHPAVALEILARALAMLDRAADATAARAEATVLRKIITSNA